MHEMGIANSILEAADREAARYPGYRAARIGIVIGEYAGVDTESLRFCFEALTKDRLASPELAIDWQIGGDDLRFAYMEMEDGADGQSDHRDESPERERPDRCALA